MNRLHCNNNCRAVQRIPVPILFMAFFEVMSHTPWYDMKQKIRLKKIVIKIGLQINVNKTKEKRISNNTKHIYPTNWNSYWIHIPSLTNSQNSIWNAKEKLELDTPLTPNSTYLHQCKFLYGCETWKIINNNTKLMVLKLVWTRFSSEMKLLYLNSFFKICWNGCKIISINFM